MREYEIDVAGLPHTVLLTEEDARDRGLKPVTKVAAVETKARSRVRNKAV